jgi:hypothetical protein
LNSIGVSYDLHLYFTADFEWDKKRTSNRLIIEDGGLTVRVKEGAGFKNAIGDRVIFI